MQNQKQMQITFDTRVKIGVTSVHLFAVGILQEWRNINTYHDPAKILSLCLPRLPTPKVDFSPLSNLLTYPASILLVQYDDGRLQLLNRYTTTG